MNASCQRAIRFGMGLVIATGLAIGALISWYVVLVIHTCVASAKAKVPASGDPAAGAAAAGAPMLRSIGN
jgi:hypothetical protein